MPELVCLTSICTLPATAAGVLARWQELCGPLAIQRLGLDARLPVGLQQEILRVAGRLGLDCVELHHPRLGPSGLPAARPASPDRTEQLEARRQLLGTLERAHRHGVQRVVVGPQALELSISRADLARRFALDLDLGPPLAQLGEDRQAQLPDALDGWCRQLDPVLERVGALGGTQLVLVAPAPWPHQFPGEEEARALCRVFAGAPIGIVHAIDWARLSTNLGGSPGALERVVAYRVADACGLRGMLPVGTGEIAWRELRIGPSQRVLTFRADSRREEIARAVDLLERLEAHRPSLL